MALATAGGAGEGGGQAAEERAVGGEVDIPVEEDGEGLSGAAVLAMVASSLAGHKRPREMVSEATQTAGDPTQA
jgi:hypothetical protein